MNEPKVTKQDVLNASSEMLNKDLYVIFYKTYEWNGSSYGKSRRTS